MNQPQAAQDAPQEPTGARILPNPEVMPSIVWGLPAEKQQLHNFLNEASDAEDYIGGCYDTLDAFLNSGADRGVIIDALAAYIDRLGGTPTFDPEAVTNITYRNRP